MQQYVDATEHDDTDILEVALVTFGPLANICASLTDHKELKIIAHKELEPADDTQTGAKIHGAEA
jgi:hypothetical protein